MLEQAAEASTVMCADVSYPLLENLKLEGDQVHQLPFLKRYPYREEEVRLLFTDMQHERDSFEVPVPIASIKRITLGPNFPPPLLPSIRHIIQNLPVCATTKVSQTKLLGYRPWIEIARDMGPVG